MDKNAVIGWGIFGTIISSPFIWDVFDTHINSPGINDHFNRKSITDHAMANVHNTDEGAYIIHDTQTGKNTLLLVDEGYFNDVGYNFATHQLSDKRIPESVTQAFNDFKTPYIKADAELPNFVSYRLTTAEPSMGAFYYDGPTQYKLERLGLDCYFDNSKITGDHQTPVQCHPMAEKNRPK